MLLKSKQFYLIGDVRVTKFLLDVVELWPVRNPEEITSFGLALRKAREEKGWSQQELAYESDISKRTIIRLEKGTCNVTLDTVYSLAKALQVDVSSLLSSLKG